MLQGCNDFVSGPRRTVEILAKKQYKKSSPSYSRAARNLFENGVVSGVWTDKGELTDEGSETASTGNVMIKEVGPFGFGYSIIQQLGQCFSMPTD